MKVGDLVELSAKVIINAKTLNKLGCLPSNYMRRHEDEEKKNKSS